MLTSTLKKYKELLSKVRKVLKMKSIDIVFPQNNEEEFIRVAKLLGTRELIFVYTLNTYKTYVSQEKGLVIKTGIVAQPKYVKEAKKKAGIVIVKSDPETDKMVIESLKPAIMYGFELQERKDFMHHRNSSLNHVLCHAMAENNVAYGFSVGDLIAAPKEKQAVILGRMYQNIMLAKKYKIKIILASFTSDPMLMRNLKDVLCLVD